ncbi:acid-sensing ion channel 3-like [Argopecten irradians]|uniref:acid-sensing ion channel 3-like n=1 Tax=Argopecten irradians TaxID=31199 RepID=UPI0037208762
METLLNEHSAIDEDKKFPALTICDVNLVKQSDVPEAQLRMLLTKTYMANRKDRRYFENLDTDWARSVDIEGIFHNHSALDMFLLCLWQNKEVPCQSIFTTRITSAGPCVTLKKLKLSETNGVGSGMGLTAILHSNVSDSLITSRAGAGFRVLVHPEQEEPDIDELGLALTLGTASLISVTKYKTSFLKHPVPAFGDEFCIDTKSRGYVRSLKYIKKYSYGACQLECLTDHVQNSCGCKGVYMPGDGPICDVFQMVNCYDEAVQSFAKNTSCECSYPCETTSYSIELSQGNFPIPGYLEAAFPNLDVSYGYMKENGLMLEVFLDSTMYFRREQILQFTASDLVGKWSTDTTVYNLGPRRIKANGTYKEVVKSIMGYAADYGVKVTYVRILKYYKEPTYTARLNVVESDCDFALQDGFWPPGVLVREWFFENDGRQSHIEAQQHVHDWGGVQDDNYWNTGDNRDNFERYQ